MNTIFESSNTEELVKLANQSRKASRNEWIFLELRKGDSVTLVKSFNTSIQIIRKDGIAYPSGWDLSVKDWQACIRHALE